MENTALEKLMKYQTVLPENFDGTFRFTNWTDRDFIAKWGNKEYFFPKESTSQILITDRTPLEIQQIRKKFAKDLADREFYRTDNYARLTSIEKNSDGTPRLNSIMGANSYSETDLINFIQRCLEPLQEVKAGIAEVITVPLEEKLSRDDNGDLNTMAVKQGADLVKEVKTLKQKANV